MEFGNQQSKAETPTRWNGFLRMCVSVLLNERALAVMVAKRGVPPGLTLPTRDDLLLVTHLCAVLAPLELATKLLEGSGAKALASAYLPVMQSLQLALSSQVMKMPSALRAIGLVHLREEELSEVARRCRAWLLQDLTLIRAKHLQHTEGESTLQAG
jgi:hypothetical protein